MPLEGKKLFWPIDVLTLGYNSSIILLLLVFGHNLDNWKFLLFYNLLITSVILFIVYTFSHASNWQKFIRYFYPMILFTFLYEETGSLVHLIFPKWFDYQINALEKSVLGAYPTVWFEKIVSVPLNEVMMLSYFSYYFLFPILGIALYLKKEYKVFNQFLFTIAVAFYISYLGFLLYPVEGPRFALRDFHSLELKGPFFTPLAQWVINVGGIHGGCMPSSHVAVALVVLVFAFKHHRRLFYLLSPFIFTLFVATVYSRFHYATDVVVGILVGFLAVWVTNKLDKKNF
ncbi:MAG TPA: phosphatase PAP2 family protein [candidate division Zixibacteria bacterium]|nr:phosphatase PAP2 family protein [candidate division Zixibacteria bacterium]